MITLKYKILNVWKPCRKGVDIVNFRIFSLWKSAWINFWNGKCVGDMILVFCRTISSYVSHNPSSNSQQLAQRLSNSVQLIQPQQAQNLHQQPVNALMRGQTYSNYLIAGRTFSGRVANASRSRRSIISAPPSQIIDLTSPPTSPTPQHWTEELESIIGIDAYLNVQQISERPRRSDVQNTAYMVSSTIYDSVYIIENLN